MSVINDPLGQTHSPASSDRYSRLKFVLYCEIMKSGDERKDGRTDNTCDIVVTTGRDCGSASWINNTCGSVNNAKSFQVMDIGCKIFADS